MHRRPVRPARSRTEPVTLYGLIDAGIVYTNNANGASLGA